jgi:hypothetical protein
MDAVSAGRRQNLWRTRTHPVRSRIQPQGAIQNPAYSPPSAHIRWLSLNGLNTRAAAGQKAGIEVPPASSEAQRPLAASFE